jgi:hypothetical protein
MSQQQEFFPSSQSSQENELDEAEIAIRRPRSNQNKTGDVTKSEHPSTYEEEVPPYSYPAQDRPSAGTTDRTSEETEGRYTNKRANQQQRFGPDGDAMENGYRPWQGPPWTRSQTRRKYPIVRLVVAIILIIGIIKLLPIIMAVVLALFGIGFFFLILPLFIVLIFVVAFGVLVLFVLSRMGIPVTRTFRRQRWNSNWRRW